MIALQSPISAWSAMDRIGKTATVSIAVAILVTAIKYAASWITGSVALYSDALESIVNVVTAIAALIAIRFSAQPADKDHPFGHHKAEYFAAVLEGTLIIVAALMILREAYDAFQNPRTFTNVTVGFLINAVATAINAGWSAILINRGTAWRSAALVADGWHVLTDVWTSLGVLAGLLLAQATGLRILDPLLASAVAVGIIWTGYHLASKSMSGLLDEAVSPEIEAQIHSAIKANGDGAMQVHDIRTRHAGRVTFIEFHLVVPGAMTVAAAHDICDRLEEALEVQIEGADVIIHVEPDHKAKRRGAIEI